MVNVCDRWNRDQTDNLQAAFFNGVGFETWENMWGIWNGITERDAEAIRRVAAIERAFPAYAGQRRVGAAHADCRIRRVRQPIPGCRPRIVDPGEPHRSERGWAATGDPAASQGCATSICGTGWSCIPPRRTMPRCSSFAMEAHGFGAVLAQRRRPTRRSPSCWRDEQAHRAPRWRRIRTSGVSCRRSSCRWKRPRRRRHAPEGMVRIPRRTEFVFTVSGIEIEGEDDIGVDVQYPWEDSPRRHHRTR